MPDTDAVIQARRFLRGEVKPFAAVDALGASLKKQDELSLARQVLQRMREVPNALSDGVPTDVAVRDKLCQQEALLTSKDPELNAATRHDEALHLLANRFDCITDPAKPGDGETLGIAGGISKRRWSNLGQLKDLIRAADFYERGIKVYGSPENPLGNDAYPHINAAFLQDLLAAAGDDPIERRARATELRTRIVRELTKTDDWFNVATRAEAWFGLRDYAAATEVIPKAPSDAKCAPWERRTTAEQLIQLAYLHEENPLDVPDIRTFFDRLLPGAAEAIRTVMIGKVGLALSGGGFRASFYHLGVLARLAERDILRDVEMLSCVSGGSIAGACYWLKLRQRMLMDTPMSRDAYVELVRELIEHFQATVQKDIRAQVQPCIGAIFRRFLSGARGVLDPERTAAALERHLYQPLWPQQGPILMSQLAFRPADHNPTLAGDESEEFNPLKHNWLRAYKVPALVLNATTVNTGHAWHFTATWMGESPWAIHESADSIPRLQWAKYDKCSNWQITLGRAVAASACVPTVFAPLHLGKFYKDGNQDIDVTLVDGGVHDNQGTVALLAAGCDVVLVSDACGQLMLEPSPPSGLWAVVKSAIRSSDTLMERVRLANYADLENRHRSGLLRGLMFLHMKAGLDADRIPLTFSQDAYDVRREPLSPSGVRKDFQQVLAELRTDLNAFTPDEACGLMACGYQMAGHVLDAQLPKLRNVWKGQPSTNWPFQQMLAEITSIEGTTPRRVACLAALRAGSKVDFLGSCPNRLVRTVLRYWRGIPSFFRLLPSS